MVFSSNRDVVLRVVVLMLGTYLSGCVSKTDVAQTVPGNVATSPPPIPQPVRVATEVALQTVPASAPANPPAEIIPTPPEPDYTLVADSLDADEVLFALARRAHVDLDIVGRIPGKLTMSAVDQPLSAILQTIARQLPVTLEQTDSGGFIVALDQPYFVSYPVDYLNMQRLSSSSVELTTQLGSPGVAGEGGDGSSPGNRSRMQVQNLSDNRFWRSLISGVAGLIGQTISADSRTGRVSAKGVYINQEAGILGVRATRAQHNDIRRLIQDAVGSAQRQVLIEATVVEVTLSDTFESGIDWSVLDQREGSRTVAINQQLTGTPSAADLAESPAVALSYLNPFSRIGDVTATLRALQAFGDVKVLSSPKIMALNNQPAVLKVADNRVYFTFEIDRLSRENGDERTLVESRVHSVPVGLVMNVVPFVTAGDEVILNVRPSISRILNFVQDPSSALSGQAEVRNLIPEIQIREMESLLRVKSGEVAIIGGLMQNKQDNRSTGVPGLNRIPLLGKAFSHEKNEIVKTELLVFLRPTVLHGGTRLPLDPLADGVDRLLSD
jgi:general secretion pathway protein D